MSTLPNVRSTSTTEEVETVTVRRPRRAKVSAPEAPSGAVRERRGWRGLKRLDWRQPHWIEVRYRHGTDPAIIVRARGREWAYPWDAAILDVVRDICSR